MQGLLETVSGLAVYNPLLYSLLHMLLNLSKQRLSAGKHPLALVTPPPNNSLQVHQPPSFNLVQCLQSNSPYHTYMCVRMHVCVTERESANKNCEFKSLLLGLGWLLLNFGCGLLWLFVFVQEVL